MKAIIVISVLTYLGFVQSASRNQIDYRLLKEDRDGKECTVAGPMCDNCDELVTCVLDEDGFHKLPQETCANGQTCLGRMCTSDRNPECELQVAFPCNDIGAFPDPFYCQTYHFCVKDADGVLLNYKTPCDGSFGYHAGTTFCQTKLLNNICFDDPNTFPVDLCLYSGQSAALAQNPSIYYICAQYTSGDYSVLYPFQFVCPHGGVYYAYECYSYYKNNFEKLMKRF